MTATQKLHAIDKAVTDLLRCHNEIQEIKASISMHQRELAQKQHRLAAMMAGVKELDATFRHLCK